MVEKKLAVALIFIVILGFTIVVLLGSLIYSQGQKVQLNEEIDELTGKYNDLNTEKSGFNTKLSAANNENTRLINEISTLKSENDDLSLERDNLKNEYIDLRDENSYLLLRNSDLTDLSDAYLNYSDELNEIIDQFKDIPGTPAVSDLDYALYGGRSGEATQILIEYPEISISRLMDTVSMSPGISSQSMVIETASFNENTLTPGQIVVYEDDEGDRIITRVHAINSTSSGICYVMKGDSNFYGDGECVKPDKVTELVIGVLFRKPGSISYCESEHTPKASSQYCPS